MHQFFLLAHVGHADHGDSGLLAGLAHPWMGVDHLLAMVMVGLLAVRMSKRSTMVVVPALFVVAMLVGAAWAALVLMNGSVEWLVSGSVLVIGLALAMLRRDVLVWALPIVPIAGVFHGYAHLTEMTGHAAGYLSGMVIATAVLHALGIALGLGLMRLSSELPLRFAGSAMAAGFAAMLLVG